MSNITIGADPEIFFKRDNKFISAIGKIGGSKDVPVPFGKKKGFAVLEDNVAAEYNIPPAHTPEEFAENNIYAIDYVRKIAEKYDCGLAIGTPSAVFTDDELQHPMAHVFGCDPDFSAWKMATNPSPNSGIPNLRSCGGHIHIGVPHFSMYQKIMLVRILDITVGQCLALLEEPNERSKLYGKPGAMRIKPYGVEWRTPSNFWLTSPEMMMAATSTITDIAKLVESDKEGQFTKIARSGEDRLNKAINNRKPDMAWLKSAAAQGLLNKWLYDQVMNKYQVKASEVDFGGKFIKDLNEEELTQLMEAFKASMNGE